MKIFHSGKTARDKRSGAHARRLLNQLERAGWNNTQTMIRHNGYRGTGAFPYKTCNGKRNRLNKK